MPPWVNPSNSNEFNFFALQVGPGLNDPHHYSPYLLQGGLLLPNRDYYLSPAPQMAAARVAYQQYAAAMLRLAGLSDADARAGRVVALEHAIAEHHPPHSESEDLDKANNPWSRADFAAKTPDLDWDDFFSAVGLSGYEAVIVQQPSAVAAEAALVASTPLETWKDYLTLHLLAQYGNALPSAFAREQYVFFDQTLNGLKQPPSRTSRALQAVNDNLADAVGQEYARMYFPPEEKARVQVIVKTLVDAYRDRLQHLAWMSPATKQEALKTLDVLSVGIGYPDHWRSFDGLDLNSGDLVGDLERSSLFNHCWQMGRIGKPTERGEWAVKPQFTVPVNLQGQNSILQGQNSINFPAAFLEPPFYDPQAPDAYNYGALGASIGHEIAHSFDAEGAKIDSEGRLRNWWTPGDLAHFKAAINPLVAQYDAYEPLPGIHVNGQQTLNENLADLNGLSIAYLAFHASMKGKPAAPTVGGFTPDQQFFLAWASCLRSKLRPDVARRLLATDEHPPFPEGANIVRNLDVWYAAFNVQPGQTLYLAPADRVRVW